ncbi:MAG: serine hydrolase [Actinobacteria bacterium]|nr:serine hydrolase [Actinomycetota bacterium]
MKMRTLALLLLAAAGLAALPAACGVKVAETATPAATPTLTKAAQPSPSASASPSSAAAATPSPSVTLLPSATPTAQAAAARRAAATVAVKAILPELDAQAADIFARSQVPGAAVAVVAGDAAVYVRCFGIREVGKPQKVDKDTVFQLASVSKGFTATMLAALVGEREIGWDDQVEKVWPGFTLWDPWVSRHVTFRDLMAQRSGLPEYAGDELEQFGYGRREILRRLRYLEPVAGFRAAYAYQNSLPTAAAEAASKATGESWKKLVRTRVLEPLGMEATVLDYRDYLDAPDRSGSHTVVDGTMRAGTPQDDDTFAPAGAVSSSIADMVPYLRMQLNGGALAGVRVAGDEALAATHAATTVVGDGEAGPNAYALGWETSGYLGRRVVQHGGDFSNGVSTIISMMPADGVGIVVLTNAFPEGHALATALTKTLYDLFIEGQPQEDWLTVQQRLLQDALKESILDPYRHLPAAPPTAAAAPRDRAAYEGVFANAYYGRVTVRRGPGAGLSVRLGRGDTLRYVPWDGDTWRQPDTETAAVFSVRDARALSVRLMVLDFAGRDGLFARR